MAEWDVGTVRSVLTHLQPSGPVSTAARAMRRDPGVWQNSESLTHVCTQETHVTC